MSRLVILGHGGFTTGSFETLVPPATTLRFFSDAGSNLNLPAKQVGTEVVFDYARVADVLADFKETEAPLAAGKVVYNMLLDPVDAEEQRIAQELHDAGKWGGDLMLVPTGDRWQLCHGDEMTCPTPKLNVAKARHTELEALGSDAVNAFKEWLAAGGTGDLPEAIAAFKPRLDDVPQHYHQYVADGVPDAKWKHQCGGILETGEGQDILWVACSGFVASPEDLAAIELDQGLPSQMTASTAGPGLNWDPDDAALQRIVTLNTQKVKDTADGASVSISAGGVLVLIGEGHEADPVNYVRRQGDLSEGTVTVTKGGAFSKGGLKVNGIAPAKQDLVKQSIEMFSDKKVTFE